MQPNSNLMTRAEKSGEEYSRPFKDFKKRYEDAADEVEGGMSTHLKHQFLQISSGLHLPSLQVFTSTAAGASNVHSYHFNFL